jgi:hypothetical protein
VSGRQTADAPLGATAPDLLGPPVIPILVRMNMRENLVPEEK